MHNLPADGALDNSCIITLLYSCVTAAVFGGLDLHGLSSDVKWTRLAATVTEGDSILTLEDSVDWSTGNKIMLTTTDVDPWHTETFTVTSVSEKSITVSPAVQYRHIGEYCSFSASTWWWFLEHQHRAKYRTDMLSSLLLLLSFLLLFLKFWYCCCCLHMLFQPRCCCYYAPNKEVKGGIQESIARFRLATKHSVYDVLKLGNAIQAGITSTLA